ncbi:hypothetical protein EVA_10491 [gut metagenome]|uniref:Uncharacterized protein n=1 Tax=gut metagenome TaxID=749906 RepID=J9G3H3_9ZZZZ
MVNIRRHHPVLLNRLQQCFEAGDADALLTQLNQLSAADFRTAGYLLANSLLPAYPHLFWDFFLHIVPLRPKAFLVTFLKAATELYRKDPERLDFDALRIYATKYANPIDTRKCLENLLPVLASVAELEQLLQLFTPLTPAVQTAQLLKAGTPPCYFLLFRHLQHTDESKDSLRTYCIYLMKRGNSIAFNMAVILQTFFDLPPLPGSFSLNLEPYELSRLNESFESFNKVLMGK